LFITIAYLATYYRKLSYNSLSLLANFLNFKEEKTSLLFFRELSYYFYFITRSEYTMCCNTSWTLCSVTFDGQHRISSSGSLCHTLVCDGVNLISSVTLVPSDILAGDVRSSARKLVVNNSVLGAKRMSWKIFSTILHFTGNTVCTSVKILWDVF